MSIAISTLFRQIRPEVKGCPEPLIENAILNAATEFCKETLAWQTTLADITLVNGTSTYTPVPPTDGLVFQVVRAYHDTLQIKPLTEGELEDESPGWLVQTGNVVTKYTQESPRTIRVIPTPDANITGVISLKAAIIPDPAATAPSLPDFIVQDNFEELAAGAKWKLMAMPDVAWSNLQMAAYYEGIFIRGKSDAKVRAMKGYTNRSLRAKPVEFGY